MDSLNYYYDFLTEDVIYNSFVIYGILLLFWNIVSFTCDNVIKRESLKSDTDDTNETDSNESDSNESDSNESDSATETDTETESKEKNILNLIANNKKLSDLIIKLSDRNEALHVIIEQLAKDKFTLTYNNNPDCTSIK